MFWEFVATIFAGLGAAGLVLILRFATRGKIPRWAIPMSAGAAMIAFQIYSEYTWFSHQKSLLPSDVKVAEAFEESVAWRPWTLVAPQTVRFIAVRLGQGAINRINPELVLAEIYFFERRLSAQRMHQVFHCGMRARAELTEDLQIPEPGAEPGAQWSKLTADDPILNIVCQQAVALKTGNSGRDSL
jgi:hypothetical protein